VPAREIHSLVHACHASMRGRTERTQLVSMETENDVEHLGEAHVMQKLAEKYRSSVENINPRT
jgi:hypothetical protein